MSSEYERKRLENIQKNNEVLKRLGLNEIIPSIQESKPKKRKIETATHKRGSLRTQGEPSAPRRVSLRARGKDPEGYDVEQMIKEEQIKEENAKRLRMKGELELDQDPNFFQSINEEEDKKLVEMTGKYNDFKIPFSIGALRVTNEMIYSIAPFPSTKLMAAAGDKKGMIGIWDIEHSLANCEQDDFVPSIYQFQSHVGPVMKLYHDSIKERLISCSYDGSIRGFDIHTQKSLELFVHPEEHAIGHFDFRENDLWFSTHYGSVGIVDPRSKHARFYEVSEKKLNTIHMNPINQSYFCTAGLDGFVRIFDVRKIDSLEPVMTWKHEKSVNSAYWSPNGNDIVSTSFDDTLGLWKDVLCKESHVTIRHNNNTGRWIQKFKAVWNPSSQTIMVGNMKRGIDLYDVHGRKAFQLTDDDRLTAIPAVNVFHLTIDMILSGNASGKMTIWK